MNQLWFNRSIKAFTVLFSYINFLPIPWRVAIFNHVWLSRRPSGAGVDFYGRRTDQLWFNLPRSTRRYVAVLLNVAWVSHFASLGMHVLYPSYVEGRTWPGAFAQNVPFVLSLGTALAGAVLQSNAEEVLLRERPDLYPPRLGTILKAAWGRYRAQFRSEDERGEAARGVGRGVGRGKRGRGEAGGGTPVRGTPEGGTPESGTPESGTPEGGTPKGGTPESGTPERGSTAARAAQAMHAEDEVTTHIPRSQPAQPSQPARSKQHTSRHPPASGRARPRSFFAILRDELNSTERVRRGTLVEGLTGVSEAYKRHTSASASSHKGSCNNPDVSATASATFQAGRSFVGQCVGGQIV